MFVLISMDPVLKPHEYHKYKMTEILLPKKDECIVGVFTTKDLAIQGILAAWRSHAGKTALIYEMLPDGVRQRRVKIYEGSFPLHYAPMLCTNQEPSIIPENTLYKRLQKLEEKLEAKCAELNNLKNDNREMSSLILRMKELIQM